MRIPVSKWALGALLILYAVVLYRTAWLTDDAYITFRSIDNFISGYGPIYNISERVQTFTHPLWMFLLSLFVLITREYYLTCMILSMLLSVASVTLVLCKLARDRAVGILLLIIFVLSRAFMDYSSSGLENPLSFFLLALFFIQYSKGEFDRKGMLRLTLLLSLAVLTRPDTLLIYLPPILYAAWSGGIRKTFSSVALGLLPLALWEMFSILYYGFPFPNTAYAKLNTGVPAMDLAKQGLNYYRYTLDIDPLTFAVIAGGLVVGFLLRNRRFLAISIGLVLYLLYVIKIGGDFMGGRFFSLPLFGAACLLSQIELWPHRRYRLLPFVVIFLLSLLTVRPSFLSSADYGRGSYGSMKANVLRDELKKYAGILDERANYYQRYGLLNYPPRPSITIEAIDRLTWPGCDTCRIVTKLGSIGYTGFLAGRERYVTDYLALADPFLSRLPVLKAGKWRIGHFPRLIPEGYLESLQTEENLLRDENLAAYYDILKEVVSGDIFDARRIGTVIRLNLGEYDYYIEEHLKALPRQLTIEEVGPTDSTVERVFFQVPRAGIEITFDNICKPDTLLISFRQACNYRVDFYNGNQLSDTLRIDAAATGRIQGITDFRVPLPLAVKEIGFDRIHILPAGGDGVYRTGQLSFVEP